MTSVFRARVQRRRARLPVRATARSSFVPWAELRAAGASAIVRCWNSLDALGDCPDEHFDLILADSSGGQHRSDRIKPPSKKYVGSQVKVAREDFAGDGRDQVAWAAWSASWLTEALRVTRDGGSLLTFIDWRQLGVAMEAVQRGDWILRAVVPWDKGEGCARPIVGGFRSGQCEYVLWATRGAHRRRGTKALPGCLRFPVLQREKFHITGKPVDLMRTLVQVAPAGGWILDPFAGSGTTLVAAEHEGRRALGLERVSGYVAKGRERLQALHVERTRQPALPMTMLGALCD